MAQPGHGLVSSCSDDAILLALREPLTRAVIAAGQAIMAIEQNDMGLAHKSDGSPVTLADMRSHTILVDAIAACLPGVPILSEEQKHVPTFDSQKPFLLIDPLDGTKEYVAGRDEFTVNVALIRNRIAVLGIIGAPARGLIWRGICGHGADRVETGPSFTGDLRAQPIAVRARPRQGWLAAVSRLHLDGETSRYLASLPIAASRPSGSALKFCQIAEGTLDLYPRLAPTSEWDIAAGDALVHAAGGGMVDGNGERLRYGDVTDDFRVPHFIAYGAGGVPPLPPRRP